MCVKVGVPLHLAFKWKDSWLIAPPGPTVDVIDSPIPQPKADEVVIKVVVSGSNPKDWKVPEWLGIECNQGDDIAGVVHEAGANVYEFKAGKTCKKRRGVAPAQLR